MAGINFTGVDTKQLRDRLVAERALNEQNIAKATKAKEAIEGIFSSLDEDKISKLERRNIYVRKLLQFDMDQVLVDEEYQNEFISTYKSIMSEVKDLLNRESAKEGPSNASVV